MFSILHISDLHQSPGDPIGNNELISALLRDRERYAREDPIVPAPNAIVVSGDIVQGVPYKTENFKDALAQQYAVATDLLNRLAHAFLDGDRSRIVIVPGNHDVDWNTARNAMRLVGAEDAPKDLAKALFREDTKYRWNWHARELYRIEDEATYASRLSAYRQFFGDFYGGVTGLTRVSPESDANIFSLHEGRIAVVAFNSCSGNDCFAFHGAIPREVVASVDMELDAFQMPIELRIAVWHHNIEGPPYRTDYMDVDIVRGMIGRGFRLGLHGHQHKAQASPHQIYLPDRETMAVVSAGSLCAGQRELPTGVKRQYNIIELSDDLCSVTIHVREMLESNLFGRSANPAWGGRGFTTLSWEPIKDLSGRAVRPDLQRRRSDVAAAEREWKQGKHTSALQILSTYKESFDQHERMLFIEIATEGGNWSEIVDIVNPPTTIDDLVRLVSSNIKLQRLAEASGALESHSDRVNLPIPIRKELSARIEAEMRLQK